VANSSDTPRFAWHTAALANPKEIGRTLKVTTTPEEGWFRSKFKDGPWQPVVIWFDDGWNALRGIEPDRREVRDVDELWTYACRQPISYEEYERVAEKGLPWSDVDETVHAQRTPPKPGSNSDDISEAEVLRDQIESALAGMKEYAEIKDVDQAGKAQSLRARLNELSGMADKKREAEKRPHLEAGKAVDKLWMPLVTDAKDGANKLRKTLEAFETKRLQEQRKREDERRRAEEEQRRREEEPSFEDMGQAAPAPPPPPAEAPDTKIRGAYGRAATIGAEFVVTSFDDYDALYGYMKGRPEIVACLEDLARKAVKAGRRDIPGITIGEKATVK